MSDSRPTVGGTEDDLARALRCLNMIHESLDESGLVLRMLAQSVGEQGALPASVAGKMARRLSSLREAALSMRLSVAQEPLKHSA